MPSNSATTDERSTPLTLRTRVYEALVGRRTDPNFGILLRWMNLAAFVVYFLALLFYMLGAAMAAGTTTPGLAQWITNVLWTLGIGAAACLYVAILLAARGRWPWAVQLIAAGAAATFVLLQIFAPPGA